MKKILLCVFISALVLCGCQNAEEIDERSFVLAAGIDKGEMKNVLFTAGCAVPDPYSDTTVKSEVLSREENTLAAALENSERKDSRSLYLGHLKAVILGREFLDNDNLVRQFLDIMERENDISLKTAVLYTEGSAKECIEKTSQADEGNNLYIWDYYKNNEQNEGSFIRTDIDDMAKSLRVNGSCFIPRISMDGERAAISGGCVLKDGKYLFELTQNEADGYLLLSENCVGLVLENNETAAEIKKADCDIKFYENHEKLGCVFKMDIDVQIKEAAENFNFEETEEMLKAMAEEKVLRLFYILKVNEADAFDMSDELRKERPALYKKYGEENSFENMNFFAECNVNITSSGLKK